MTGTTGFLRAVGLVLRLRVGGLVWGGTPCSSWVFMNRGTSKRTASNPLGDCSEPSVRLGNLLTTRFVLLVLLGVARGAMWCCEQPMSSLMPRHPRMQQLWRLGQGGLVYENLSFHHV